MKPLSPAARTICDVFAWFLIIFGVVTVVHGGAALGGGFQGGAIAASSMVLLIAAHGGERILRWVRPSFCWIIVYAGLFLFIGLAFAGMGHGTFFSSDWLSSVIPFSGATGATDLMNAAVGLEAAGGLTVILLTVFRRAAAEADEDSRKETGYDS